MPTRNSAGAAGAPIATGGVDGAVTAAGAGASAGAGGADSEPPVKPTFLPQVVYRDPDHNFLQAIAAADLDDDGKVDLAVAKDGGGVLVLINQGGGVFAAPQPYPIEADATVSGGITIADLDGDGHPDLALKNWGSRGDVSVLRNNGDGTFAKSVEFESERSSNYNSVIVAFDLNGDSRLDLVGGGGGILLNAGSGSFVKGVPCPSTGESGVAVGDLDGDGMIDLALSSGRALRVYRHRGPDTCGVAEDYPTICFLSSVAIVDVDSDGNRDVVSFCSNPKEIDVWLNQGDGSLLPPVVYELPGWPWSATMGDINGDGSADFAIANYDATTGVTIWLNDGHGALSPGGAFPVGLYPQSVAIADLNGDGKQDLAVANHDGESVSVLLSSLP